MRKNARFLNNDFRLILQKAFFINNKAKNTKFTHFISGFIHLAVGAFIFLYALENNAVAVEEYKIKTIVIDAGHGGKDPGAIGYSKKQEKDITLAVSLKLGELIKKNYPNIKVVYTRTTDVFVELQERAAIANKANADLFISIHCNANNDRAAYGTETYCLGLHRSEANLEVAKRENSVILLEDDYVEKYDGFDPNASEAHIIFSLFQNAFLNQSISFASKIDNHLSVTSGRKSRGVKQAGFLVLYKTTMPGVLIELGFISNKNEEAFLHSEEGQDKVAEGLLKAFSNYKTEAEGSKNKTEKPQPEIVKPEPKKPEPIKEIPVENPKIDTAKNDTNKPVKIEIPQIKNNTKPDETKSIIEAKTNTVEKIPNDNTPEKDKPSYIFKVQFMASKVKLPDTDERLKKVIAYEIEKADNGYLRYVTGNFFNLKNAESMLQTLKSVGFTDAFIVPYENGNKRITLGQYLDRNP